MHVNPLLRSNKSSTVYRQVVASRYGVDDKSAIFVRFHNGVSRIGRTGNLNVCLRNRDSRWVHNNNSQMRLRTALRLEHRNSKKSYRTA